MQANRVGIIAAIVAAAFVAVTLLAVWVPTRDADAEMERFGTALARTLAETTTSALLHKDRLELAVVANEISRMPEVAGVAFFDTDETILAMSGSNGAATEDIAFRAAAGLDDTIVGQVRVTLEPLAFGTAIENWRWLATLVLVLLAPLISAAVIGFLRREARPIPIVSVPGPDKADPEECYALIVNLHNQLSLSKAEREEAGEDAMQMAREVCAIHTGFATALGDRGVLVLFDRETVNATQAVTGAHLLMALLSEFETVGEFRCFLTTMTSPASPAELTGLDPETIPEFDLDNVMALAAISRSGSVLLDETVRKRIGDAGADWVRPLDHPLIEDLAPEGGCYTAPSPPPEHAENVERHRNLILGFS